jgi:hypothetical protein
VRLGDIYNDSDSDFDWSEIQTPSSVVEMQNEQDKDDLPLANKDDDDDCMIIDNPNGDETMKEEEDDDVIMVGNNITSDTGFIRRRQNLTRIPSHSPPPTPTPASRFFDRRRRPR